MASRTVQGGKPEGRIARSWRLSKIAWRIVRSDRAILILALISALFAAATVALIYDLTGFFSGHRHRSSAHFALVTLVLAFPTTFVSVFFNTAIAAAVAGVLEGKRLSLREALAVPARRLGQVAMWSLLATVVGVIIEQIARRLPLIGSLAVRLLGLSWSLASLFAIPILATEGCSAPECLRRSARLVRKRWGEGVSGNVIITAWALVLMFAVAIVFGFAIGVSGGAPGVRLGLVAALVIAFVLVMAASGVVRQTFDVVLYRYAVSGNAAGGFSASDLDAPFSKGGTAAAQSNFTLAPSEQPARRRDGWSSVWPWLVSGLIAGALVLLVELNKRHYRAHHLSGRIVAAVMILLVLALIVRFVIWLGSRALRLRLR